MLLRNTKLAASSESDLLEDLELVLEERVDDVDHALAAVRGVGVLTLPAVEVEGELEGNVRLCAKYHCSTDAYLVLNEHRDGREVVGLARRNGVAADGVSKSCGGGRSRYLQAKIDTANLVRARLEERLRLGRRVVLLLEDVEDVVSRVGVLKMM